MQQLAEVTRDRTEPPLVIAHCLRDIAYGNESQAADFEAMLDNPAPAYRDIFVRCFILDK